jgi:hypothetical protein
MVARDFACLRPTRLDNSVAIASADRHKLLPVAPTAKRMPFHAKLRNSGPNGITWGFLRAHASAAAVQNDAVGESLAAAIELIACHVRRFCGCAVLTTMVGFTQSASAGLEGTGPLSVLPSFIPPHPDPSFTLGIPDTSQKVIALASYIFRDDAAANPAIDPAKRPGPDKPPAALRPPLQSAA